MLRNKRTLSILVLAIVAGGATISAAYFLLGRSGSGTTITLPAVCSKPQGGYLIVANFNGYNDSADHGVPMQSWPVIEVQKGAQVTITVCNADGVPHGFQINHYVDNQLVDIYPHTALTFTFTADQSGTFRIFCDIFCPIHWAMLSGTLIVS